MPYYYDQNNLAVYTPDPNEAMYPPPGYKTITEARADQQASYTPSAPAPTTLITAAQIEQMFIDWGVDPSTTYSGVGTSTESAQQRYARIASEINAGTTDITKVTGHLSYMAEAFGEAFVVQDPTVAPTQPFELPPYVAPEPAVPDPIAPPVEVTPPVEPAPYRAPEELVRSMVSWLPSELIDEFVDAYIESGSFELAREAVRGHSSYDAYFPGNRREDGSLRYNEEQYLGIVEGYEDALLGINVNPDTFRGRFGDLVAGLVSPNEFEARVDELYTRVISNVEPIREFYATNYGVGMTTSAIVASLMDPDIGDAIINERISISEIGGEAKLHEFGINLDLATQLYQRGLTRNQAGDVFTQAASDLPVLDVLAARHNDPDDEFDLNDFLAASVFGDPNERLRIRRLLASERSLFTEGARWRGETSGAITGLVAQ